jgi:hypothetical protein
MEMGMASIQKNMMAADMSPIPYCLIEMTSIHKFRVPQIEAAHVCMASCSPGLLNNEAVSEFSLFFCIYNRQITITWEISSTSTITLSYHMTL